MTVRPYKLRLKKVSGAEQELLAAVYSFLPATGAREGLLDGLRQAVADELGESFSLVLEAVEQQAFASFCARLPRHPIVAVIGLAPYQDKMLCEIDQTLALMAVERLLGGHVKSLPEPRQLSETEQAVLQYLIAKVLSEVHRRCKGEERIHFRLERLATSPDEAKAAAAEESRCAVLAYRAGMGRHAGFARLVFPEPFVKQAMLEAEAPGESKPGERAARMRAMERYHYVRTALWAEAGRATVTPADIARLEEGDVVLLEGGDLALSGLPAMRAAGSEARPAGGRVILRAGLGEGAGLDADVTLEAGRARACVRGIHRGE
ncbi:MAG: hypothetical protein JXA24_02735 [Proteobacteria bacterium]|nr:hypothetical protein [Pseudomonadota bacterium]